MKGKRRNKVAPNIPKPFEEGVLTAVKHRSFGVQARMSWSSHIHWLSRSEVWASYFVEPHALKEIKNTLFMGP